MDQNVGENLKLKPQIGGSHSKLKWVVFFKQGEGNLFFVVQQSGESFWACRSTK